MLSSLNLSSGILEYIIDKSLCVLISTAIANVLHIHHCLLPDYFLTLNSKLSSLYVKSSLWNLPIQFIMTCIKFKMKLILLWQEILQHPVYRYSYNKIPQCIKGKGKGVGF